MDRFRSGRGLDSIRHLSHDVAHVDADAGERLVGFLRDPALLRIACFLRPLSDPGVHGDVSIQGKFIVCVVGILVVCHSKFAPFRPICNSELIKNGRALSFGEKLIRLRNRTYLQTLR